jgi:cell division protein FtsW
MARKLKSDRILFLATLLLVCLSVVMVYSASAVGNPYDYLMKQLMWVALGLSILSVAMRNRLPQLPGTGIHLVVLAVVTIALIAVLFMPRVNGARRGFRLEDWAFSLRKRSNWPPLCS